MHNTEIFSFENNKILFMVDSTYKRFCIGDCTIWIKSNFGSLIAALLQQLHLHLVGLGLLLKKTYPLER